MKTLSGIDGAFLQLETPETPMHVGSLALHELPGGYHGDYVAKVRAAVRQRLHLVPVFTRKLAEMPLHFANPVWVEDDRIDLDYHVQHLRLPEPGTQVQLEDLVGRLHSEPLDRSRPLWRIAVIDGLQSGQVGYYIQVHHAALDGKAGVMMAQALFDLSAKPAPIPRGAYRTAEHPGMAELAAAALKHDAGQIIKLFRHLPEVVKTLAGLLGTPSGPAPRQSRPGAGFAPKTPLNVQITGERGFAAVSVPLATLKQLAVAHEAKLNDIVLALCSGLLRRYLAKHGGLPKKPLIAAMPISLRAAGNTDYTTQATMSLVNLASHIADPVKRLRAIRDASLAVKAMAKRAKGVTPTDFPSIGMPWLMHALASWYGRSGIANALPPVANVVISNVPGPQLPLYAAGARMKTYWPLSIVEHGQGLNITVMSYVDAMGFGFTTARAAVPDARELTAALLAALDELVAVTTKMSAKTKARPTPRRHARAAPSPPLDAA